MYSLNFMGQTITCETAGEVVDLVYETARKAGAKTTTRPTTTTTRPTTGKKVTAAQKRARAKKARAAYKAKQDAKKAAATTAETHHGSAPAEKPKQHRADTSGEVIGVLRRSGVSLTIDEIKDDLHKAGWKYQGTDPKGTIRATLNRLVAKETVARGTNNGDITFRIARVAHADPLPHQQRESDV